MLSIEKKIYNFVDKYLPYIVALVVAVIVLFMNRQVLYCVRPYEGADMWEASNVFVHSPVYVFFLRKIWIELFDGSYERYRMIFWVFSYSVAVLAAIIFCQRKRNNLRADVLNKAVVLFCVTLITPLSLLYGPVMLHMDGMAMTLILMGVVLSNMVGSKWKWFPFGVGFTLAIAIQINYIFLAVAIVIYSLIKKKKNLAVVTLACVAFSFMLNVLIGSCMGFSVTESLYMIVRFLYISQATGTIFTSVCSWILYMVFWNGYWIGMLGLFAAFEFSKKIPLYTLLHTILFFFATVIFFNGYF